jgi:hypothetical protein
MNFDTSDFSTLRVILSMLQHVYQAGWCSCNSLDLAALLWLRLGKSLCWRKVSSRIWGSHSGFSDDIHLLGYNAVQSVASQPTFWALLAVCFKLDSCVLYSLNLQMEKTCLSERNDVIFQMIELYQDVMVFLIPLGRFRKRTSIIPGPLSSRLFPIQYSPVILPPPPPPDRGYGLCGYWKRRIISHVLVFHVLYGRLMLNCSEFVTCLI